MSFITEYFDCYRAHKFKRVRPFNPERRYAQFQGKWLDPKIGSDDEDGPSPDWTDDEIKEYIRKTMHNIRGESTYFTDYCKDHPQDLKTRPLVPRIRKKPCRTIPREEIRLARMEALEKALGKFDSHGSELMKEAKKIYEKDLEALPLKPLDTHTRVFAFCRPRRFLTGISDYSDSIGRLAYEMMRDDSAPKYKRATAGKPDWGLPPEKERQPKLEIIPFEGERLF